MSGFDISGGPDNWSVVNKLDESRKHAAGEAGEIRTPAEAAAFAEFTKPKARRPLVHIGDGKCAQLPDGEPAPTRATTLPKRAEDRKTHPIASGVLDYFPDAIAAVAHVSYVGNEQHNPGQPLHWARGKSGDEADALMRHFVQRGSLDSDMLRHSAKVAWRALALLQKEIEAEQVQRGDDQRRDAAKVAMGQMR